MKIMRKENEMSEISDWEASQWSLCLQVLRLTRSVRFLMARPTPFSVGGSRAFSRNRAMEPSFSICTARGAKHQHERPKTENQRNPQSFLSQILKMAFYYSQDSVSRQKGFDSDAEETIVDNYQLSMGR